VSPLLICTRIGKRKRLFPSHGCLSCIIVLHLFLASCKNATQLLLSLDSHNTLESTAVFTPSLLHQVEDESIDAVFVLTSMETHCQFVIMALEAGKHVFVEKPVSSTLEEIVKMESCAAKMQKVLRRSLDGSKQCQVNI
jgi:hypothetical protein